MQVCPQSLLAILLYCLLPATGCLAQVKWDGEAGDGLWSSPLNWSSNLVPQSSDDVLLDNSLVTATYNVALTGSALVHALHISPASGNRITLTIPNSSTALPAIATTGTGYSIALDSGAVLLNASGMTAGAVISITDSFKIANGATYIHQSRSSHASLVSQLSRSPGTEKGIFEFDVPGGSYTIAITNRVYGTLLLDAGSSGGSQAYSGSAANPLLVNGDLIIHAGVSLNLDNTAATTIRGNLDVAGLFNLASQPNNNTVFVQGDVLLNGGQITETSTGLPTLECNGNIPQRLQLGPQIKNSVALKINNPQGVDFLSDCQLPYQLTLAKGIVRNHGFLLSLLPGCGLVADSANPNCFVDGRLRKEGLNNDQHFLFPVGDRTVQRWLSLNNATGNFTVEFFRQDPHSLSAIIDPALHHISSIEYWSVTADGVSPSAAAELSFNDVNSGGVTDLQTLRVAQWDASGWKDKGNVFTTGSAGAAGSVASGLISFTKTGSEFFTLASSVGSQNPLPVEWLSFQATRSRDDNYLVWQVVGYNNVAFFEVQRSSDAVHFTSIARTNSDHSMWKYNYADHLPSSQEVYYRILAVDDRRKETYSATIRMNATGQYLSPILVYPCPAINEISIRWHSEQGGQVSGVITGMEGRTVRIWAWTRTRGVNQQHIDITGLSSGVYQLRLTGREGVIGTTQFVKQ